MSRTPLQGRVEEIVIREPKPSWGSRIGDVLGDVFSGIGTAVREYGPAVLQGLANASSLYNSSSGSSYSYDVSPSSLPDYSSSSRNVRIQVPVPQPIKQRPLPKPRQTPRMMETYGRSLQEQRARRQQQIEDLMATNEQAANRRGIAGQLGQYSQPGARVQPSRRQEPVDIRPAQAQSWANVLNSPHIASQPIQEDSRWIQGNLLMPKDRLAGKSDRQRTSRLKSMRYMSRCGKITTVFNINARYMPLYGLPDTLMRKSFARNWISYKMLLTRTCANKEKSQSISQIGFGKENP